MEQGRVLITAQAGTAAQLGNLCITPALRTAKFQLYQKGSDMSVSSLEGELDVTDGVDSIVLPAGEMMTHAAMEGALNAGEGTGLNLTPPPAATGKPPIPGWAIATASAGASGGAVAGLAASGVIFAEAAASCSCSASATAISGKTCK
jgi:hypothetical protein